MNQIIIHVDMDAINFYCFKKSLDIHTAINYNYDVR